MPQKIANKAYHRYHIEIKKTPHIQPHPRAFNVRINRLELAKFLIKELIQYRGNLEVVKSRPCVYGVFSGPLGGFLPKEHLCVGCLRCTTQYPEMVTILRNPERLKLGDSYFLPYQVDAVVYEAQSGRIPIRGMGYRGKFGGNGWDSIWTDMSEIVRPTRDGIHGREYISTEIDIGAKRPFIELDANDRPIGPILPTVSLPIPMLFDAPSTSLNTESLVAILSEAARQLHSLSIFPWEIIRQYNLKGSHFVPLLSSHDLKQITEEYAVVEVEDWNKESIKKFQLQFPQTIIILRTPFESDLMSYFHSGTRNFHLTANYHGKGEKGRFVADLIREAHQIFVQAEIREEVTLLGSGGIVAAEHLPKAIICGLDGVVLDTPLYVGLQARFSGSCVERDNSHFTFPSKMTLEWGKQRLKNLSASWRDQLLEILGAMGLREVRRLRGEIGRAMFQEELEKEAFADIEGYEIR